MVKILMVCLGNICRSPLAEGILKSKLSENSSFVDSAGTSNYHIGEKPDIRSIQIAKHYNIDISNQRGRQFLVADFDRFDVIYAMDNSNYKNIISLARDNNDLEKVNLILNENQPDLNLDVPDPYYGGDSGFDTVFKMLDLACDAIAKKIKD